MGLQETAVIERDSRGIATMKTKSLVDIAVATGFIHAQERFFKWTYLDVNQQENLFCALALDYNKSIRRHRFRDRGKNNC